MLLHVAATAVYSADPLSSFELGALGWSALPYIGLLLVGRRFGAGISVLCGAVLVVALDANVLWSVYMQPRSSTAALNLLAAPFYHLCIVLPLVALAAWFERRYRSAR